MTISLNRVIVVGASSGIGAAIAQQLAQEGGQVAALGRRQEELERLTTSGDGRIRHYVHDVRQLEEVPLLFDRIVEEMGGLDGLIYAAGAMTNVAEGEYGFDADRAMVEVNLLGAMAWMNLAAARFEAAHAGTILGISSIAGERGRRGNPAYCTSKAALTTYLESLRNRASRYGVNVVTIKPGFVDTAMTRGMRGLFWMISAADAAAVTLRKARRGNSWSGFVPWRWNIVALIVRAIPSFVFRRLDL